MSLGLPAVNDAIASQRLISSSQPLAIGDGVTVIPAPNTAIDARGTAPASNVVLLVLDGVRYRFQAVTFTGSLDEFATGLRDEIADQSGPQAIGPETTVRTRDGVAGRAARFVEPDGGGWYAVYLTGDIGALVVVTGTDESLFDHAPDVDRSIATLRFEKP